MNILYISSFDLSLGRGPSVNERTFLNNLNKQVENLYCIHGKSTIKNDLKIKKSYSRITSTQKNKFFFPLIELYKFLCACYIIKRYKVDFIIARVELFPISIYFLSIIFKDKIYIKTLGGGLINSLSNNNLQFLNSLNNYLIKVILKKSFAIDTVSERFKQLICKTYDLCKSKVHVIDNGVDLIKFKKTDNPIERIKNKYNIDLSKFDYIIGYAGNLAIERGGIEVINAVNYLNNSLTNKKIAGLILGGGHSDKLLKNKFSEDEMKNIVLTGNINFDDLPMFISCLDIGFSILHPKNQGASAQKVRQYVACNVFTITTPGQENFVEKYGVGKIFENKEKNLINIYLMNLLTSNKHKVNSPTKLLDEISIYSKVKERISILKKDISEN